LTPSAKYGILKASTKEEQMNETLSGKGYIQGGEGVFITSTGERYGYNDGKLTQTSVRPWPSH
jgi:hypothetical protein